MEELWFVLKVFGFTVLFLFLSQIRVGPVTVEDRMHAWIQSSSVTGFMQGAAEGGVKLAERGWLSTRHWMLGKLGKDEPKRHERRPQGVPEVQRSVSGREDDSSN